LSVDRELRVRFFMGGCEAEEPVLLEAIVRKRLMETQQAGKRFIGCWGDW
jgi:hypothetical protein